MTIKQQLDALRAAHPGCSIVAFGDAATHLVLRASHDADCRREHLDSLCDRAVECFAAMDAAAAIRPEGDAANEAILLHQRNATVCMRANAEASEFLCIVSERPDAIEPLVAGARDALPAIMEVRG